VPPPPGARLLLAFPGLKKSDLPFFFFFRFIAIRSRVRASCRASARVCVCAQRVVARDTSVAVLMLGVVVVLQVYSQNTFQTSAPVH
jgi:hypothetical protein